MRKELYDKLSFEERCMYRIEENTNKVEFFNLNIVILTIMAVSFLVYTKQYLTATLVLQAGVYIFIIVTLIKLLQYAFTEKKKEKEWNKYIIDKLGDKP